MESNHAQKLREALEELRSRLSYLSPRIIHIRPDGKHSAPWVMEQLEIIEDALAAPPRNCDVGTAEEQDIRFEEWCHTHKSGHSCRDCSLDRSLNVCALEWAQMPYAATEGGAE